MNWLPELVGEISKFEASHEERIALVSLANQLSDAAADLKVPKPRVMRNHSIPALVFDRYLAFLIEDPMVPKWVCVHQSFHKDTNSNTITHVFQTLNMRERLRTFFEYP